MKPLNSGYSIMRQLKSFTRIKLTTSNKVFYLPIADSLNPARISASVLIWILLIRLMRQLSQHLLQMELQRSNYWKHCAVFREITNGVVWSAQNLFRMLTTKTAP